MKKGLSVRETKISLGPNWPVQRVIIVHDGTVDKTQNVCWKLPSSSKGLATIIFYQSMAKVT